jgi:DNA-binding MarR family transcriptional regulator
MSKAAGPSFDDTIHVRDHCLCLNAQRLARMLSRRFDGVFRPLGITSGQFSLMMALNRPEPPTMGSVASLLAMDRTTLTAALKPLARQGLINVAADAEDRRARRVILTDAGRGVLGRATDTWRSAHETLDVMLADDAGPPLTGRVRGAVSRLSADAHG